MGRISSALIGEDTSTRCLPKVKGWGHMLGQVTGVRGRWFSVQSYMGHCSLGWKEGPVRGEMPRAGITDASHEAQEGSSAGWPEPLTSSEHVTEPPSAYLGLITQNSLCWAVVRSTRGNEGTVRRRSSERLLLQVAALWLEPGISGSNAHTLSSLPLPPPVYCRSRASSGASWEWGVRAFLEG